MTTINAHFDGKVFVPDEPVDFPKNSRHVLRVKPEPGLPKKKKKYITAEELARSPIVGIWKDRQDMADPVKYVQDLRRRIERREI
jgi:hypothetical protein